MITLTKDRLTVDINEFAAEISSVRCGDTEFMWQGDPAVWSGRAPIMFPFCGMLPEGGYIADGTVYDLPTKHGFARHSLFEVEEASADAATFVLRDSEKTRAMYPYRFTMRARFALDGNTLQVTYTVQNDDERPMYFSIGSHEAYACPEGVEAYEVVFEQPETAGRYTVASTGHLNAEPIPFFDNTLIYEPKADDFTIDAIVTKDIRSRRVVLQQKNGGRRITVEFPGFPYLLFWQKPGAKYLCIEPWCGIAQQRYGDRHIEKLEGIESVAPGEVFSRSHTIRFEI